LGIASIVTCAKAIVALLFIVADAQVAVRYCCSAILRGGIIQHHPLRLRQSEYAPKGSVAINQLKTEGMQFSPHPSDVNFDNLNIKIIIDPPRCQ
jgi:hypothetical protein